ncbi:probable Nucleoporin NUP84 [Zygosaccharomyces bailii ISA1307]|nr:probable Nucleoporin NUP84 [Zygosaccharomyces bailii ISA1307]
MDIGFDDKDATEYYVKFGEVLKDFKAAELNSNGALDPFIIIKHFRSIAGEAALKTLESNAEVEENSDWELEAKLWHLLELLGSYRGSDIENGEVTTYGYNSAAVYEKKLLQENKSLYQIWIIIFWIQSNMNPRLTGSLPTSKWSNSIISGGLKSYDLDFPLRDSQAEIDIKDKEEDHVFYKYVFQLLLAGKFEKAFEECRLTENLPLNMILCGMQEYLDPIIDTQLSQEFQTQQGVKKHALWRRTVYSLSNDARLDQYERAIYRFLAGTIPDENIMRESSWESELLLYLNQNLQIEVENYLLKKGKLGTDELIIPLPSNPMSLQSILDLVSSKHVKESEHPIRILIGAVILNTLSLVLHSSVEMLLDIVKGDSTDNYLAEKPFLLRIVTHISIFLNIVEPHSATSTKDKCKLITAYITVLKFHGLYETIPIYITFLDEEDALEAYSFILSTLEDPQVRKKQLEIAKFLQLPVANILRKTTQRIFEETELEYTPSEEVVVGFDINDADRHLISGVEWLLEGKLYVESVESIVALSRRFLINGRVKALEYFMDRNPLSEVLKNYEFTKLSQKEQDEEDCSVEEILQYQYLINGLKKYEEWQKTVKLLNSESNIPTVIEKFQEFSKFTHELIKKFLGELSEDEHNPDRDVFYEIRSLYTPYLIIELHKGLVEASRLLKIPKFLKDALEIATLVANETDKIYLFFQSSGKLKEYLQLVAYTAILSGVNVS